LLFEKTYITLTYNLVIHYYSFNLLIAFFSGRSSRYVLKFKNAVLSKCCNKWWKTSFSCLSWSISSSNWWIWRWSAWLFDLSASLSFLNNSLTSLDSLICSMTVGLMRLPMAVWRRCFLLYFLIYLDT